MLGNPHPLRQQGWGGCQFNDLPSQKFEVTPETITGAIINRVNVTSALWQQPGFLCDVIVLTGGGAKGKYYEDLPVDYVREKMMLSGNDYFLITLEYGQKKAVDPFNVQRIERTNKEQAEFSNFLHPIVRQYREGELVSTHHIIEDLAAEWLEEEHIQPLLEYCQMQINNPVVPLAMV
ncbi:MAG: hypothetical protein GDA44_03045 [Prochloron sp. SP5CPC1]|nr:hypothetical protein [Candidatus Paraprochloron terpiosi SP5CPC1]